MPAKSSKSCGEVAQEIEHDWTRYWAPGEPPGTTGSDDAYLMDPEGFFGRHAATGLVTLEEIAVGDFGCLLLCGDPGLGKTRTLERWRKRQASSDTSLWLDINFRTVPDRADFEDHTLKSETWQWWLAGWPATPRQLTLVVDGVDEGTIKIPGFVAYLADRLKDQPLEQLRLVMVCRSLDWPQSEGERLMALWPAGPKRRKFELGRLRLADVQRATRDYGINPDEFLHAVRTEGLDALAARPLTLRMLLAEYIRKGRFPPSRSELIRDYLRAMCQEIDPNRSRRVKTPAATGNKYTADDIYQTAAWMAAMLLIGAKAEVQLSAPAARSRAELSVGDLTNGWRKLPGTIPAPELLHLTTQTPVFASRGTNVATFQHQVFAELLAA